jgi:methylated-DNA-[protein]-cysteine S-methyltransferase
MVGLDFLGFMPPLHSQTRKEKVMSLAHKMIASPVGRLKLVASDRGLVAILWEKDSPRRVRLSESVANDQHPVLLETERQLREYFAGKRKTFSIALDMRGTRFQKDVWEALLAIPFAETRSYGQLAKQLGNPRATRAVGAANGKNPVSIIVPCHRVIGSSGKLTGFAGGLDAKAQLLSLEKQSDRPSTQPAVTMAGPAARQTAGAFPG